MRPGRIRIPSAASTAGNEPALASTAATLLGTVGARWVETRTAAGRSAGRYATSCCNAFRPPAEAPTTTMSLCTVLPRRTDHLPGSLARTEGVPDSAAAKL